MDLDMLNEYLVVPPSMGTLWLFPTVDELLMFTVEDFTFFLLGTRATSGTKPICTCLPCRLGPHCSTLDALSAFGNVDALSTIMLDILHQIRHRNNNKYVYVKLSSWVRNSYKQTGISNLRFTVHPTESSCLGCCSLTVYLVLIHFLALYLSKSRSIRSLNSKYLKQKEEN